MSGKDAPKDDLLEAEEDGERRGCFGCFRWLAAVVLLLLLVALLWPVSKEQKAQPLPYKPPSFSVITPKLEIASDAQLAKLDLKNNYRTDHLVLSFELKNDEAKISSLSWDNFELIVKQGKLTKYVRALRASEGLYPADESPWGLPLASGRKVSLRLLFKTAKEAEVESFRVYDADRRMNKYKDFPLNLGAPEAVEAEPEPPAAEAAVESEL